MQDNTFDSAFDRPDHSESVPIRECPVCSSYNKAVCKRQVGETTFIECCRACADAKRAIDNVSGSQEVGSTPPHDTGSFRSPINPYRRGE